MTCVEGPACDGPGSLRRADGKANEIDWVLTGGELDAGRRMGRMLVTTPVIGKTGDEGNLGDLGRATRRCVPIRSVEISTVPSCIYIVLRDERCFLLVGVTGGIAAIWAIRRSSAFVPTIMT
jgi:hypothetical protein